MTDFLWIGLGATAAVLAGGLAGWGLMAEIAQITGSPSAVYGGICLVFAIGFGYLVFRGWMSLAHETAFRRKTMSRISAEPRLKDPLKAAKIVYLNPTAKPFRGIAKAAAMPGPKETVTLRIDPEVLDFFRKDGRGWPDRINAALRKAAGQSDD